MIHSGYRYVGEAPRIIDKMTNFWRLVFLSINWLLATLCDTLITIRENHWLLRIMWRFSKSVSECESVLRICVWLIIHTHFPIKSFRNCNVVFVKVSKHLMHRLKNSGNILIRPTIRPYGHTTSPRPLDCIDHPLLIAKLNAYGVDTILYTFWRLTLKKEAKNKGEWFLK